MFSVNRDAFQAKNGVRNIHDFYVTEDCWTVVFM